MSPRHRARHRVAVGSALFQEGEGHRDLVELGVDGGMEPELSGQRSDVGF